MHKWFLLLALSLLAPLYAHADCAEQCSSDCSALTGSAYEECMVPCLQDCQKYDPPEVPEVPTPTPVE